MAKQAWLTRVALRICAWSERWFPDAYVFAALGVVMVAVLAMVLGASPMATASAFGEGFWSLIPFTMQMCFIIIGGYTVASSPAVAQVIEALAKIPSAGRAAVAFVALLSMLVSLLHWGLSLIFGGLLVRALAAGRQLCWCWGCLCCRWFACWFWFPGPKPSPFQRQGPWCKCKSKLSWTGIFQTRG